MQACARKVLHLSNTPDRSHFPFCRSRTADFFPIALSSAERLLSRQIHRGKITATIFASLFQRCASFSASRKSTNAVPKYSPYSTRNRVSILLSFEFRLESEFSRFARKPRFFAFRLESNPRRNERSIRKDHIHAVSQPCWRLGTFHFFRSSGLSIRRKFMPPFLCGNGSPFPWSWTLSARPCAAFPFAFRS